MLLVVVGLVTAAAALRPEGGLLGTVATGPVGGLGFVVLLVLGWGALVGRFAVRFREEVRHLDGPTPRADRLRETAMVLLPVAAVVVPVLLLVLQGRTSGAPEVPHPPLPDFSPQPVPAATTAPVPVDAAGAAGLLLTALLALAGVAAVVLAVVVAVRLSRWTRRPETPELPAVEAAPADPEAALAEAVDSGLRALAGADARAAVIACYAAMEGSLAASGLPRQSWESPTELLRRALSDERIDAAGARELTALFREARYSTHPMDDGQVRRARTALDAIAARLAAAEPPAAAAAPAPGERR
ncbi:membrane protein [Kitasatospora xanthocidica]|uniref:DUF4129 domain-containing protein n=1 Tax=Kitasatospora xanthocidica TaxID=83382 RepID=UPI0016791D78|nr:DUF4129 domain-containing protein [Kitasatospora xanthocidica]GHF67775.1 membrane protein [Kitasatospora xanthocidica]